ncbi:MAG TPA: hypothetical protein VH500_25190 [Nitrososphaeraceae archaeon]
MKTRGYMVSSKPRYVVIDKMADLELKLTSKKFGHKCKLLILSFVRYRNIADFMSQIHMFHQADLNLIQKDPTSYVHYLVTKI